MINKFISRLLDLNFLRKSLGYQAFLSSYAKNLRLKILSEPKNGRVLALAPHPDDEVFGCGGVLAKHRLQKDKVKIVYLTGNDRREKEARVSTQILGIDDLSFLNFKDGSLAAAKKEVAAIKKIIYKYKPNIIYAPNFLDTHPDHQATAKILAKALTRNLPVEIWLYEIWTPIFANRIIKIDDVFERKTLAIKAYKSQMGERRYLSAISGLNAYRAGMFNCGQRAEAFFKMGSKLYRSVIQKYI